MGNCLSSKNTIGSRRPSYVKSKANVTALNQQYDINKKCLGRGSFGKVFEATNKKDKSMKVAVKVINKNGMKPDELEDLKNEVAMMYEVDHTHIVKYYETYDDHKYIYLVMELLTGGELLSKIHLQGKHLDDQEASKWFRYLLTALVHCHSQNIIHRDIKPENIMFSGEENIIKFIDFGLCIQSNNRRAKLDIAGTPYYIAPEVLSGTYGKECDIWSLGVCIYQFLCGEMPFDGEDMQDIFEAIKKGEFECDPDIINTEAEDLIRKMLVVNPDKRITAKDALEHPWIKKKSDLKRMTTIHRNANDEHQKELVQNLKQFKGKSVLKRAAMNVLVKHMSPKDVHALNIQFQKLDTDGSGFILPSELSEAIKKTDFDGQEMTQKEIDQIIKEIDYAGNAKINYSEFIAATLDVSKFLTEEKLEGIFSAFDMDNSGQITVDNLQQAFSKFNKEITKAEIDEIMKEHDFNKEGSINLEEFKKMMLDEV